MLANSLLLHLSLTPGVGSKGKFLFSFPKVAMLYIKLIGMGIEHHASKISALLYTLDHCVGLKGHTFFLKKVLLHITLCN